MSRWRVTWTATARHYYSRLDRQSRERIVEALQELERDPFACRNARRLHGQLEGLYRYRVGKLRMVFRVLPEAHELRLLAIASRGDIYK